MATLRGTVWRKLWLLWMVQSIVSVTTEIIAACSTGARCVPTAAFFCPSLFAGLALASGLAATVTITHLLKAGDGIVCMDDVYGGEAALCHFNGSIMMQHHVRAQSGCILKEEVQCGMSALSFLLLLARNEPLFSKNCR